MTSPQGDLMDNTYEMIEPLQVQVREMITGIGTAVAVTVLTAENDLVEQGHGKDLVLLAAVTGALNAIGGYMAVRVYPEADRPGTTERLQSGLHRAIAALLRARQVAAAESEDAWPTGRFGTA